MTIDKDILFVDNLSKAFGKKQVLKNLSFRVEENKNTFITGESGSGKSTLTLIIVKLIKADSGDIFYYGESIFLKSFKDIHKKIQLVLQDSFSSINPRFTVFKAFNEVFTNLGIAKLEALEQSILLLKKFSLSENILNKSVAHLSGGQRQRISIARALILKPRLIIFDESFFALDRYNQNKIMENLLEMKEELKLTYIFSSHDDDFVKKYADAEFILHTV